MDFKKYPALIILLCAISVIPVSAFGVREPSRAEFALGTVCSLTLFENGDSRVYREIFDRIREIDNLMSVNIPASELNRVNAAAGIAPVHISGDVFTVIERSLHFAELSGGAFDPTVGPLVSLWGISGDNPRVPSQAEIDEIMPLINWRDVEINHDTRSVFLKREGMAVDLGAIAKGYAADEAATIISNAGIKRAIIDLGGNILILGEKENKSPWTVGIQNPNERRGIYIGILHITAQTVVTSGVYERFFEKDGTSYHHIFSPYNGCPVDNDLLSVTIIASNSMDADALSTAVFVMGYEKGRELIESLPGTEAVFIFEDLSVRKTAGADFTITDKNFILIN